MSTDWTKPITLSKLGESLGFTMSDVAFVSGLDESTVSRLWDDPKWLDRISGKSLLALAASVPGVADYFSLHSVLAREARLIDDLQSVGLIVNSQNLTRSASEIARQHVVNALEAALQIMNSDASRVCSYLVRFWGREQDRALELLYTDNVDRGLLKNPDQLVTASAELAPRLVRKGYSFHSILAQATFAHHIGKATGKLPEQLSPEVTDRQSALMMRSGVMGLLINSNDQELAERYQRLVSETPILRIIEDWSFPAYARDCRLNSDLTLPSSLLLRNTADEILYELRNYSDAYVYYLVTTYLPLALSRDQTFGLKITELKAAILDRRDKTKNPVTRIACEKLADQIVGI